MLYLNNLETQELTEEFFLLFPKNFNILFLLSSLLASSHIFNNKLSKIFLYKVGFCFLITSNAKPNISANLSCIWSYNFSFGFILILDIIQYIIK